MEREVCIMTMKTFRILCSLGIIVFSSMITFCVAYPLGIRRGLLNDYMDKEDISEQNF